MTATGTEITKAYRDLALRYHPDRHKGNDLEELAAEKLVALNKAYEVLGNSEKRAVYDAQRTGSSKHAPYPAQQPRVDIARSFKKSLLWLGLLGAGIISLRFIRNPKAILVVAIVLAAIWFGPRLLKLFKKKNK